MKTLTIILENKTTNLDQLLSFKQAILNAINENQDAIIFSKQPLNTSRKQTLKEIKKALSYIVDEDIYILHINSASETRYSVYDNIEYLNNLTEVNSFVIFKPLFNIALSIREYKDDFNCSTLEDIVKILAPNNFGITCYSPTAQKQNRIQIVSPFRNGRLFLKDYFDSIFRQKYENYAIHLIDDASDDDSKNFIPTDPRLSVTKNKTRKFALQNIVENLIANPYEEEDIICLVDADDVLVNKYVLNIINTHHQGNTTLLTYGSMKELGKMLQKQGSPYSIAEFENLRTAPWRAYHIRTFKFKLFKKLLEKDPLLKCLKDSTGKYHKMPYDMAILFPLMEIAGYESVQFIDTLMYGYRHHENNDRQANKMEQYTGEKEIRSKISFSTFI